MKLGPSQVAYLERTISRLRLQRGDAAALEDDICGQRDGFGNIQQDSSVCEVTAPEEPRELDVRQEAADDDIDLDEAPARNVCSVHASSSAPPAWGGAKSLMISKEEKAEEEQEENDKQEDENAASSRPSECIPKFADAHEFDADEFGSPSEDQQGRELGRGQYVWQWQRAKGNFCSYAPAVNARIEDAYRRGYSKVRVKSGKGGQVPMEIFFVDTAQLDPKSRNLRKLRRLGRKSWQVELTRHAKAVARSVLWGEPRGESVKMYGMRQSSLLRRTGINVHSRTSERSGSFFEKADNVCSRIVRSTVYATVSLFVMLLNVVWIGISADLFDRDGKHLFHPDRHWLSPTVECIFMVYFLAELIVEITSMKYKWKWYRNPDLRVDAVCTITIMLEVLVVPWTGIPTPALQSLRLIKLARLVKLTRKSKDAAIVLRGLFSGMRSAAVIWLLIAVLLYTYSVLLTTATTDPVLRDKYFGSVGQTVATLITHGIAHDGVADFIYDLRMNHGFIQALVVATFVFVAYFGAPWRMLVGAFCRVAIEVAGIEEDLHKIEYLRNHLQGIIECYMEDGVRLISCSQFLLAMTNADVLQTLRACGTDIDGLMTLVSVLFPDEESVISFDELFSVIVRLRKAKPASISDMLGLQEFTKLKFDLLEEQILREIRDIKKVKHPHDLKSSSTLRSTSRQNPSRGTDISRMRSMLESQGEVVVVSPQSARPRSASDKRRSVANMILNQWTS
ncbi:unnamed protein product [Prorocentrum cordatum]|uniref:WWE domain-containing protein n=1 Tax=Prorocentrum cordatum TaxID=2364126 RepID=A0ABN9Y3Y3_9DINO|nr:unnamed protein product [Polarella glacialis]